MKIFGIKLNVRGKKPMYSVLRFSRDDYIFWSAIILFISFLSLTGYDVYMFYQDVFERSSLPPEITSRFRFSNNDIDEIISLMDERKSAYDDILKAIPAGLIETSTAP